MQTYGNTNGGMNPGGGMVPMGGGRRGGMRGGGGRSPGGDSQSFSEPLNLWLEVKLAKSK